MVKWSAIAAHKRTLAQEQGAVIKDWGGRLPVALLYPNTYHVGMSSLAVHALYAMMNSRQDIVCERAFYGGQRAERGEPPLSIESQHRLADFAVVASSFSFELDYLNFAVILGTAGIAPLSRDRTYRSPLILAGGPAVSANPEPLAELCDAFVIGEAEEVLPCLLDRLVEGIGADRHWLLEELAAIPGVYVPALAEPRQGLPAPVERQWVTDLDQFPTHTVIVTGATEFGDMYLIEIARGCGRGCRFCLAGCLYRPPRERSVAAVLDQAQGGRRFRCKVGLVSAAVSDYSQIEELVTGLRDLGLHISVSSLRVDPLPEVLLAALAQSGARTLTVAPEAGSERLRTIIHKNVHCQDILDAAVAASRHHFSELKLYFMIGLPTEEDEDVQAITELVSSVAGVYDGRIVASVAPFVPKAQTPFEREAMVPPSVLRRRMDKLRRDLRACGAELKAESIGWATVQAVLARGNRSLGPVVAGLRSPSLGEWSQALEKHGLHPEDYTRALGRDEQLPWGFVRVR